MTTQIQLRRDTAANWTANNPTLAEGELGFELDTNKFKIGNGTDDWNTLSYITNSNINPSQPEPWKFVFIEQDIIQSSGFSNVKYADNQWVAIGWKSGVGAYFATSPSAIGPWTSNIVPTEDNLYLENIHYANGLWVAVGVAAENTSSPKLRTQYSSATLLKTSTDTWYVYGDIV